MKSQRKHLLYFVLAVVLICLGACKNTLPAVTTLSTDGNLQHFTEQTLSHTPTFLIVPTLTTKPASSLSPTENLVETPTLKPGSKMVHSMDESISIYIPEGYFVMGSNNAGVYAEPAHRVFLDAFWIDQKEVTNQQFNNCVNEGICSLPSSPVDFYNINYELHPVVYVDWFQATTYCGWAGGRLPTEAEWEKAGRSNVEITFPWGDQFNCSLANADDEIIEDLNVVPGLPNCDGYNTTAPVGSFPGGSSYYGVMDLVGNVTEWVSDWFRYDYYSDSPSINPLGPIETGFRVIRGGSWRNNYNQQDLTYRRGTNPSETFSDVGFRCAYDADLGDINSHIISSSSTVETSAPAVAQEFVLPPDGPVVNPIDGTVYNYIPAGRFFMGSEIGHDDELPVHSVFLEDFWIGQTEVTKANYHKCVIKGNCGAPVVDYYETYLNPNFAVVYISWRDAQNFCEWVGGRLPTEAEWEKAARGGVEGKMYPWGNQSPVDILEAKNGVNHKNQFVGMTVPNEFGLYDMIGNGLEWTSSCYQDYPYVYNDGREDSGANCSRVQRGKQSVADRTILDLGTGFGSTSFRCVIEQERE